MAIVNYTPVNTDDTIYLIDKATLADIVDAVKEKWGDVHFDNITIESKYIHTRCLTYDQYDSSDFDNYLVITLS